MSDKLRKIAKNIKPKVTNKVVNDKLVLTLSGSVGKPYWFDDKEEDFINEKRVKALVGDSSQDIIVKLNSPGGDVFEGIATYNCLKSLDNHVTVEVTALAASAASIIAMAGDEIVMCTGSQMMLHEASTITWGNKSDHQKSINALESVDNSLVSVYADKTGVDCDTITNWLSGETWFTAEEAVESGLATSIKDKVIEDNKIRVIQNDMDIDELVTKISARLKEEKEAAPVKNTHKFYKGVKK